VESQPFVFIDIPALFGHFLKLLLLSASMSGGHSVADCGAGDASRQPEFPQKQR
jgi:hypothetical protein